MNGIRGLVFDCDGVLFESRQANLAYYNVILNAFDVPPVDADDHDKAHLCHTAASRNVFSGLLGEERVDRAMIMAAELDYREFIPFMQPEPGLSEALASLSAHFPLAVATNRGYSMPEILEHFGLSDYFTTVVTSRDVAQPKPQPDMLLEAADRLCVSTHELLFIGDSELDQAAALAAKMPFAIYRGSLAADVRIDHHQELVAMFVGQ